MDLIIYQTTPGDGLIGAGKINLIGGLTMAMRFLTKKDNSKPDN